MLRRRREPEPPPPALTFTDPSTGEAVTAEAVEIGSSPHPRRRLLLAAGGAVLLLVAVTVVVLLQRGPEVIEVGLPRAVTEPPSRVWTRELADQSSAVGVGDQVLVSEGALAIVGLDRAGEEVWTYDDHNVPFLRPAGVDDVAIGVGDGVAAISARDGTELWWHEVDDSVQVEGGAVLVLDRGTLRRYDVSSGDEVWSLVGVESQSVGGGAVFAVADGELRRLDLATGREVWAVDSRGIGLPVAANDEMVLLAGDFAVAAYDVANGSELWSLDRAGGAEISLSIGVWSSDRVFLATADRDADGDSNGGEVEVRDRDGTVGRIPVGPDDDVFGIGVEAGGDEWFVDTGSNGLYDEQLRRVVDYPGAITPADEGVYSLGEDELGYYPYGESQPAWELPVESGDEAYLTAADDLVLLTDDGTLTAYR